MVSKKMDWNDSDLVWTDELIERYLDEHPRDDGDRALAKEILLHDIAREQ